MALVAKENPGGGILVDASAIGRPIGDTSSGACFVSDLPKNFQGGDEALHFALGELFGQYGKIKKIELYMDKGILDTENFKGEALVVYHPNKFTGTHDDGDPVYEACRDMDGKFRVLGHRNWRMRVEAAEWQKEGFNVKDRAKKFPCVEIGNLWEYKSSTPMSWFGEVQDAIRKHAAEHIKEPFVKVEPSEGTAMIWCKGAQDAMKFAALMQKSYFMGRKVVAQLCRKEKPLSEVMPKVPKSMVTKKGALPTLSMKLPDDIQPGKLAPEVAEKLRKQAEEMAKQEAEAERKAAEAAAAAEEAADVPMIGPTFLLREGCKVFLKDLVSKPENNGKGGTVVKYLEDVEKYQVRLEDGRFVKLKPENVEAVQEPPPKRIPKVLEEEPEDDDDDEDDAGGDAQAMAAQMARGDVPHGPEKPKTGDEFEATVCVDPSLLPKKEGEAEEEPEEKRERSRSRERRRLEQQEAIKARVEKSKAEGKRCGWVVSGPAPTAAAGGAADDGKPKEPEESREELLKMSVANLKQLLIKFGKTARGCLEKKDFVDRLKPPPKS
eukprot:TRINITY_DN76816_c0_g1_i1.p1 TRINITY_DN76816_c0_g1~~TRINITY_DN76816_c0_g1_i1.p1  ORF type:complete len:570 (-),score=204.03 TRINITY_DN76816_c0_g1_i1:25-1674(-)